MCAGVGAPGIRGDKLMDSYTFYSYIKISHHEGGIDGSHF